MLVVVICRDLLHSSVTEAMIGLPWYYEQVSFVTMSWRIGKLQGRINWLVAICVALTVALLINLGFWQLGRAEEKRELQREMQARQSEPTVSLAQVQLPAGSASADQSTEQAGRLENMNVSATGRFWNEASFLVAFQFFQGAPGFELITPFELNDSEEFVLISRGWIAPGPGTDGMPYIAPVEGVLTVSGQLHIPDAVVGVTQVQGEAWPLRFRRLDMKRAATILERPVRPYVMRLSAGEPGVMARHWPAVTVSTRNNVQYSIQWFGMALAVIVIAALMSTNVLALWRGEGR